MKYVSTRNKNIHVTFEEAVKQGLAPDVGLYMPELITPLDKTIITSLNNLKLNEIAYIVSQQYVANEIPLTELEQICNEVFNFEIPLVRVKNNIHSLELYHGPTAAFKDVGARFMARCLGYFSQQKQERTVILVATSGDTGSAVAQGFLNVEGVDVVILYPSGKVSDIQEKQLTSQGGNITALEVLGTFDDCQKMVKTAFSEYNTNGKFRLTSANSINIARLLPQSFYFYYAVGQLNSDNAVISVPSGNFGNLTGGLIAHKSGLPIHKFVASTNINDTFPIYLQTGNFESKPSVATISNAMDVGNPSNFERMEQMFDEDYEMMRKLISAYSFTDAQTKERMLQCYTDTGYITDPHGAVALLGLEKELKLSDLPGIFLETAHPAKFSETVFDAIGIVPEIPDSLKIYQQRVKKSVIIQNSYEQLKDYLNDTFL